MASDSSCTSSIIDSGFESTSTPQLAPIAPPRKRRIKKEIQHEKKKGRNWSAVFSHQINKISNFIEKVVLNQTIL